MLKEPPRGHRIPFGRDIDVDDLTELVDRAVDVTPPASNLDLGLVGGPAVPDRVAGRASRVDQQRCEPLHPPVDRDVINLDAAFGEQLLDIAVGQSEPQIPTNRQHDHLGWEPEPSELRGGRDRDCTTKLPHGRQSCRTPAIAECNRAP